MVPHELRHPTPIAVLLAKIAAPGGIMMVEHDGPRFIIKRAAILRAQPRMQITCFVRPVPLVMPMHLFQRLAPVDNVAHGRVGKAWMVEMLIGIKTSAQLHVTRRRARRGKADNSACRAEHARVRGAGHSAPEPVKPVTRRSAVVVSGRYPLALR